MHLQFDHIIHFMKRPEDGMERLKQEGIHAVRGGVHEKRGSYNTLSHFGLSYVEMLGIFDERLFRETKATDLSFSPFQEIERNGFREGFAKICLRTDDLHALANKLQSHGIETNGPVPLSRKTPDGKLLEWELLYAGGHDGELPLPFFIDWGVTDEARYESLKTDGVIAEHPAGSLELAEITFLVRDGKAVSSLWQTLFELEAMPEYVDEGLKARCYPMKLKDVTFVFASPEEGELKDVLEAKGEHPYRVVLTGANEERTITMRGGTYELRR